MEEKKEKNELNYSIESLLEVKKKKIEKKIEKKLICFASRNPRLLHSKSFILLKPYDRQGFLSFTKSAELGFACIFISKDF